jgi:hypothetical protein
MKRSIKVAPFFVLVSIFAASCPARAKMITFQCGTSFIVDLTNNTVNHQPALIDQTAIDWQLKPGPTDDTGVVDYHIDRTTGILTEKFTYHLPNGRTQSDDPTTYRCTVVGANSGHSGAIRSLRRRGQAGRDGL